ISPECARPRPSSPSTRIVRRRSSRWRTTASSVTCSRSCPRSPRPFAQHVMPTDIRPVATNGARRIRPADFQPELPVDRLIVSAAPVADAVPQEVVFVGGGPAGLAGAIELSRLVKQDNEAGGNLGDIQIAVLEKASALGEH